MGEVLAKCLFDLRTVYQVVERDLILRNSCDSSKTELWLYCLGKAWSCH